MILFDWFTWASMCEDSEMLSVGSYWDSAEPLLAAGSGAYKKNY